MLSWLVCRRRRSERVEGGIERSVQEVVYSQVRVAHSYSASSACCCCLDLVVCRCKGYLVVTHLNLPVGSSNSISVSALFVYLYGRVDLRWRMV